MEQKNLYRLGQTILTARLARAVSQKALALSIGVDGSRLSALEKGRAIGPATELVTRIAAALNLSDQEKDVLLSAAAHDRVMRETVRNFPAEVLPYLALSLDAARLLGKEDRAKLTAFLRDLLGPRRRLSTFPSVEEETMT